MGTCMLALRNVDNQSTGHAIPEASAGGQGPLSLVSAYGITFFLGFRVAHAMHAMSLGNESFTVNQK